MYSLPILSCYIRSVFLTPFLPLLHIYKWYECVAFSQHRLLACLQQAAFN
jgi:hypothetical protein